MKKFLTSFYTRLAVGLLFVCALPAFLLPHWNPLALPAGLMQEVSMAAVALAFVASMLSMQRFDWFPGRRSIFAGITIVLGWYGVLAGLLMATRLPYSLTYLTAGLGLTLLFMLLQSTWMRHGQVPRMGYVPLGRASRLDLIKDVEWVRLDEPVLPNGGQRLDAIVADLHAPALTNAWQKFLADCTLQRMPVYNIRQVEEALTGRVKIHHMYENNLGSLLPNPTYMAIKYLLDVGLIVLSLPVVLPVMLLAALAIKLESPGPIFFLQKRVGQLGKEFTIYKFRSMCNDSEKDGAQFAQQGDMRVTRVGKFIRKTRIDELPQFFNIIKGDMSLIGPRPEQKVFVDQFEGVIPFYSYRHIVKPGISGWAQVVHGYAADADETQVKVEHDFYYIKNFSFSLDVLIVFLTLKTMATGFGAR